MLFNRITKLALGVVAICSSSVFAQSDAECSFDYSSVDVQCGSTSPVIVYEYDQVIKVPCSGTSFQLDFDIDGTANVLFSISSVNDPDSPVAVVGRAGGLSGDWQFSPSSNAPVSASESSSGAATVSVVFDSEGAHLLRDGEQVATVSSGDLGFAAFNPSNDYYIFFAAESSQVTISNIEIYCFGSDGCQPPSSSTALSEDSSDSSNSSDSGSEETSGETSESVGCSESSSISPVSVDSTSKAKNYNLSSPLMVPCSSGSFSSSIQVNSDSDLFIAFADAGGYYSASGLVEAQIGLFSGRNTIKRGRMSSKRSESSYINKRFVASVIDISFSDSVLTISRDGTVIINYSLKNFNISQMFIASNSGVLSVYGGSVTCQSADFCTGNPPIPCNNARILPDQTYVAAAAKVYNATNNFVFNCYGTDFSFSADVTTTSDIYVFIATADGFNGVFSEIRYGIQSGVNVVNNVSNFVSAANLNAQTGPAKSVSIGFRYVSGTLSMTINGSQVGSRVFSNWSPIRFNISPLSGYATLTKRQFTCLNQVQGCS
ncbi:hypothetical protein AYI68_g7478 [Smittium mucronatum]|uniref:Uncharacterized protein n=1 Tax=Smittium mucronatum TaxID=133383 RepID=A0A1R0GNK1_9FUNG|nr:hypothetical protein AYI68_g7478 [Smittium mucronatum]